MQKFSFCYRREITCPSPFLVICYTHPTPPPALLGTRKSSNNCWEIILTFTNDPLVVVRQYIKRTHFKNNSNIVLTDTGPDTQRIRLYSQGFEDHHCCYSFEIRTKKKKTKPRRFQRKKSQVI